MEWPDSEPKGASNHVATIVAAPLSQYLANRLSAFEAHALLGGNIQLIIQGHLCGPTPLGEFLLSIW